MARTAYQPRCSLKKPAYSGNPKQAGIATKKPAEAGLSLSQSQLFRGAYRLLNTMHLHRLLLEITHMLFFSIQILK